MTTNGPGSDWDYRPDPDFWFNRLPWLVQAVLSIIVIMAGWTLLWLIMEGVI